MNLKDQLKLSDENYHLLFGVRRSIRYHEYRRNFYQKLHKVTNLFTLLMAGAVLLDAAKEGITPDSYVYLGVIAALFAAFDLVIGFASQANAHGQLRERFAQLEIDMMTGLDSLELWSDYQRQRLLIEKDEPAVYHVLNILCHNELLVSEGVKQKDNPEAFFKLNVFYRLTRNMCHWENITSA
ncbi:MAG: hypothetical protein QX189_11015 [Methylococcales bacterium]